MRFGILGNAKIARTQVIPAILEAGHIPLTIGSRGYSSAWPDAPNMRWTDYAGVVSDPHVEAIYIALPNHLHAQWTVAALNAGKHVLCEKPMALSLQESQHIQAATRATGKLAVEAYMVRHHPQWQWLKTQAKLGAIRQIQVVFNYDNRDPHNIRNAMTVGGGALWDIGCYAVFTGHWLMGRSPDHVSANLQRHPEWGIDIHTQGTLHWQDTTAGDTHLQFMVSTQSAKSQSVYVVGDVGWAQLHAPFNPAHNPHNSTATWAPSGCLHQEAQQVTFQPCNAYTEMVMSFVAQIDTGQAQDALASAAITHTLTRLINAQKT